MTERRLEDEAARQLEEAGFFVQRMVRLHTVGSREAEIDIVAWAGSESGELVPDLIVEVKRLKDDQQRAAAARQLGYYVPLVNADRAYIFDGSWHLVSDDFDTAVPVDCPHPNAPVDGVLAPLSVIQELVWRSFDMMRSDATPEEVWRRMLNGMVDGAVDQFDPRLIALARTPGNRLRIGDAILDGLSRMADKGGAVEHFTPPALAAALVRLLVPETGLTLADPFCGLGVLLRAVHTATNGDCKLFGQDINQQVVEDARKWLRLGGVGADLTVGDSLVSPPTRAVDAVVASPPMGLRLGRPVQLQCGGTSREGNVVAVDRVLSSLRDGGRAVMLVQPSLLFAGGATEQFRAALSGKARIVTIIELPAQRLPTTAIRSAVVVLEKSRATKTLVARLEDDWERQLSEDGEFMRAYRTHLETRP